MLESLIMGQPRSINLVPLKQFAALALNDAVVIAVRTVSEVLEVAGAHPIFGSVEGLLELFALLLALESEGFAVQVDRVLFAIHTQAWRYGADGNRGWIECARMQLACFDTKLVASCIRAHSIQSFA
jgi:hypothetical protein